MNSTIEEPAKRTYTFRFKNGDTMKVDAQIMCKPDDSHDTYRLKREGNLVGEFHKDDISAWTVHDVSEQGVSVGGRPLGGR